MPDDYPQRLKRAHHRLDEAGIWKSNYDPLISQLSRRLGLKTRPPHFQSFLSIVVTTGTSFGVIFGVIMWLLIWRQEGLSPIEGLTSALMFGIFFGFGMAIITKWSAWRKNLPRWEEL